MKKDRGTVLLLCSSKTGEPSPCLLTLRRENRPLVFFDVSFDFKKSFKEQVNETLNSNFDSDRNHVYVGQTTSILKQIGLKDLPMLMTKGHLRDINHDKVSGTTKYHGISEETINKLPYMLDYPAIIFDSVSDKNSDAICILSQMTDDDGLPIMVVIKPDGKGKYNNVSIDSNFILTMFGKDNPQGFLNLLESNKDNVLYINQKRTQEMTKAARLYLPAGLAKLRFDTIIHKSKNVVNASNENLTNSSFSFASQEDIDNALADFEAHYGEMYRNLIKEYGAIEKGMQPRVNDVEVPRKSVDKRFVSRHARTIAEAGGMSEELHGEFEKWLLMVICPMT